MAPYALIAEPDPARAAGLLALVTGEGLEGVVARDGAEAQELVRQRSAPLLLVTDLALPRVDGFALLTWLRERDDAAKTQVVVVTAFDELRVRAWQHKDTLGIHSLLSRRATPEQMRDTVKRVITGQRAMAPFPVEPTAVLGLPAERIPGMALETFCQHGAGLTADPAATLRQLDPAAELSRGVHLTLERPQPRRLRWVARPFPVPGGVAPLLTLSDLGGASPPFDEREQVPRMDALTGLDMRRTGEERLLREIGRCRRDGVPFSLLLVDLVGLGCINMTRGFDTGDTALRDVARRLEGLRAPSGFAVRWEGGTLLLALPGLDAAAVETVRQRLHAVPGAPKVVCATVCVEGEEDPQSTLARAQAALTRAKAALRSPPLG